MQEQKWLALPPLRDVQSRSIHLDRNVFNGFHSISVSSASPFPGSLVTPSPTIMGRITCGYAMFTDEGRRGHASFFAQAQ